MKYFYLEMLYFNEIGNKLFVYLKNNVQYCKYKF